MPDKLTPVQLRRARKCLRLTQAAMAEKLDITVTHYAMMERGETPVRSVYALAVEALKKRRR